MQELGRAHTPEGSNPSGRVERNGLQLALHLSGFVRQSHPALSPGLRCSGS